MYKLKNCEPYHERKNFANLIDTIGYKKVYNLMNKVKPLPMIPGLKMATNFSLAEYFEVSIRLVNSIYRKYFANDSAMSKFVNGDVFKTLANNKTTCIFEGMRHAKYDFGDFTIHCADAGCVCFKAKAVVEFLKYIDSEVCSEIIQQIIDKYAAEGSPLKLSLSAYREAMRELEEHPIEQVDGTLVPPEEIPEHGQMSFSDIALVSFRVNLS